MDRRSTKIVATLGPATSTAETIERLIAAGVDVARLNMSHGDHTGHTRSVAGVQRAAQGLGRPVAILADLQGPKIRLGTFPAGGVNLVSGGQVALVSDEGQPGSSARLPLALPGLTSDLDPGDRVLIDDGRIRLSVIDVTGDEVHCRIDEGGTVTDRKGVNLPDTELDLPPLTPKDLEDLAFAVRQRADFICLSFVRQPGDIDLLRYHLKRLGSPARIVAKIEKHQALEHIVEIIEQADAVMVARGDLGVEIAAEQVPRWQKRIIREAIRQGKEVITATQMLESMVASPTPTRAEASDVANAVYDGTSAVMLSAETAVGQFPVQSVATMDRIVRVAEEDQSLIPNPLLIGQHQEAQSISHAISRAAVDLAQDLNARAILTPTQTGATARQVARYRPPAGIIAASPHEHVWRQLALTFGVTPMLVHQAEDTDGTLGMAIEAAVEHGFIEPGDLLVLTAGLRINTPGATNLIKVERAASSLDRRTSSNSSRT